MPTDRFIIAPFNVGQESDLLPWLIPDDAFEEVKNAYIYRGRVIKRPGNSLFKPFSVNNPSLNSRLRFSLEKTTGANFNANVPGAIFKIGQMFSIGDNVYTVKELGVPGTMLSTGGAATHTFDTTAGVVAFTGLTAAVGTDVFFYPSEPVMGFNTLESASINDETTIAFDTQFAYQFTGASWAILGPIPAAGSHNIWTGTNSQFFSGTIFNQGPPYINNTLYVTNFNATDNMRYYNPITNIWGAFQPFYADRDKITTTTIHNGYVETARIIVAWKDRLLLLNTVETEILPLPGWTDRQYGNRCRYTGNGVSPLSVDGWSAIVNLKGGYIDASTSEQIIGAQFVKDHLIVYFERSTWEIRYTNNQDTPFIWQQIDDQLGAESTFSLVPFNSIVLGIGDVGIHACNGQSVERIDKKIPDEVFKVRNTNDGVYRVHGIRDYNKEMVYWTFPSQEKNQYSATYPSRILSYNYENGTWSFYDNSVTAFGYVQLPQDLAWIDCGDEAWATTDWVWDDEENLAKFRKVVAGNQEGFTFLIDPESSLLDPTFQITNITAVGDVVTFTVLDHNLVPGDYFWVRDAKGVTLFNENIYQVNNVLSSDTFTIIIAGGIGVQVYTGSGTMTRVYRTEIKTRRFGFYLKEAKRFAINKVSFLLQNAGVGHITLDYHSSGSNNSLLEEGLASGAILGTNVLSLAPETDYEIATFPDQFWRSLYLYVEGDTIQLHFKTSDEQMVNVNDAFGDFELNAILFYCKPTQDA